MKNEMLSREKTYACMLFFFICAHKGMGEARGQALRRTNEVIIRMTFLFVVSYFASEQTFWQNVLIK